MFQCCNILESEFNSKHEEIFKKNQCAINLKTENRML